MIIFANEFQSGILDQYTKFSVTKGQKLKHMVLIWEVPSRFFSDLKSGASPHLDSTKFKTNMYKE